MRNSENIELSADIWNNAASATLATLEADGMPHASLVTLAQAEGGKAIMLLSTLARHTQNLKTDHRCSLLVVQEEGPVDDILTRNRISVHGSAEAAKPAVAGLAREWFLAVHPAAALYADFADFEFYLFESREFHLVGGFGRINTFSSGQITGVLKPGLK